MAEVTATHSYTCPKCGARIEFGSGTGEMVCPYCGHRQEVAVLGDTSVDEHPFAEWQRAPTTPAARVGTSVIKCTKCGAETETDKISDHCQFCASPVVIQAGALPLVAPEAVIPFQVDRAHARDAFRTWVRTRWFAPSALKKVGSTESMDGTYLPNWTYDAHTESDYTGQRGEHYWETETYTEMVDGRSETRTRQVMKTRWYPAWGHVGRSFDDVLVPASHRLPEDVNDKLGPWRLAEALAYQPDYLAGFVSLRYEVEPDQGLEQAKHAMAEVIETDCARDIGGDEQRVNSVDTAYSDLAFKLVLLPVWIAAYLYRGKAYQVFVNANTGSVMGRRPYSVGKISLAVALGLAVVAGAIWLYVRSRSGA